MLIASSPVEIEAEAAASGMPEAAHAAARQLFHDLTDRLGQAVVALSVLHEDWPSHRFFFAARADELEPLLAGLRARPDILDVTDGVPPAPDRVAGLWCRAASADAAAVLVGHESHDGYAGETGQ